MKIRQYILIIVLVAVTGFAFGQTTPAEKIEKTPELKDTGCKDSQVMANINGQPIYMDQLVEILVDGYGIKVAQQIISTELVRQSAAKKDIVVIKEEIQKEHDDTLKLTFPSAANENERKQMFEQLLESRGLTRKTWDLVMTRNAILRKMVPVVNEVPKEAVDREIARRFGKKVVVRHIELNSLQQAKLVRGLLKKADFVTVAKQYSLNLSRDNGGLLPPIGKDTQQVSPALRQVALAMKAPGDISDPVQVGKKFHILKLDKIIPAKEVKDESIRKDIVEKIKQVKLRHDCNKLLQNIMKSANIEIINPILKQKLNG